MEQARFYIAIGLSFLVILLWSLFAVDQAPVEREEAPGKQETKQEQEAQPIQGETPKPYVAEQKIDEGSAIRENDIHVRTITVETGLFRMKLSEKGGSIIGFTLKEFKETNKPDSEQLQMVPKELADGTLLMGFKNNWIPNLGQTLFKADLSENRMVVKEEGEKVSLIHTAPNGIVIEKTYTFYPGKYLLDMIVTVKNGSDSSVSDSLTITLLKPQELEQSQYGFEGPSVLVNSKLEQIELEKDKPENIKGDIKWMALQDRYFMSSLIPKATENTSLNISYSPDKIIEETYIQPVTDYIAGTQKTFDFSVYFGPKSLKILKAEKLDLEKAVNFGWFDIIAKPCVYILNFIHDYIPNYGIAIIILTIITKIIFWPLGNKSYKSMAAMKKLQPLIGELKEKHKGDRKKMNEETMGLYKTYKVNPLGGCLPMLVQLPVFIALYRMLYEAIELRHAPFFGWITDLSQPDRLFDFGVAIPLMDPPYGIPVLTLAMGASMFFQQKMSPPPGDPTQAKMMMFMPLIFTVIFINFSSGLVLYWLVNNLISMGQQFYIQKKQA